MEKSQENNQNVNQQNLTEQQIKEIHENIEMDFETIQINNNIEEQENEQEHEDIGNQMTQEEKNKIYNKYFNTQQQNQTQQQASKYKQITKLEDLPAEERQFMLVDKDSGKVLDMRDESVVAELIDENSLIKEPTPQAWNSFWKEVRKLNEKLLDACEEGKFDLVKELLEQKSKKYPMNINYQGLDNWTPLHNVVCSGHVEILEFLINKGINLEAETGFQRKAIHIAAIKGNCQVAQILIKNKVDINVQDGELYTPLHYASEKGFSEFVELLLKNKAKTNLKNSKDLYPLDLVRTHTVNLIFERFNIKDRNQSQQSDLRYKLNQLQKGELDQNNLSGSSSNNSSNKNTLDQKQKIGPRDFKYYKRLGSGAFGDVFLVRYIGDGQVYAMKVLKKEKILKQKIKRYTQTEKEVLSQMNHPFITKLHYSFQDDSKLFLILEYCPGGDLGDLIRQKKKLNEETAKIYIAEIILALEALHKDLIVYRDLKPDNVILDAEGHAKLTDFGLAKKNVKDDTHSFLGTPAYFAPEIVTRSGHNRALDWYNLGILLYELLVGMPPFYATDRKVLYENIKNAPLKIPKSLSPEAKNFILRLLNRNPKLRLGAKKDSEELKSHPFFANYNWDDVYEKKLVPPVPKFKPVPEQELTVVFTSKDSDKDKFENWTEIIEM